MVPSAERVRFHSSGTEATQMAVRLARAFRPEEQVNAFPRPSHGWLDEDQRLHFAFRWQRPDWRSANVANNSIALDPYETQVERLLNEEQDIAGRAIVEPLGAATGKVPSVPGFLRQLRDRQLRQ